MMKISAHPNNDIRQAIDEAIKYNWTFKKLGLGGHSHAWGKITCPAKTRGLPLDEWCSMIIYRTPRNASSMAKMILRKVQKCNH